MNDSSRTNRHWINYSIKTNYSCQTNYLSETNFSSKINYSDIPFQVDCKEVSYSAVHGSLEHAPNYILHIHPPAILHNYLPYNIHYASPVSSSNEMSGCLWSFFNKFYHCHCFMRSHTWSFEPYPFTSQLKMSYISKIFICFLFFPTRYVNFYFFVRDCLTLNSRVVTNGHCFLSVSQEKSSSISR